MEKSRRKKIWLSVLFFLCIVVAAGFFYRYRLVRVYQSSKLRLLKCDGGNCLQRIWVHRVNSIERYNELKDEFEGFEADIVYDNASHSFSVYHPPLAAGEKGIPLDSFVKEIDLLHKHLWLDTRFVDSSNMREAIKGLPSSNCIYELYDATAAQYFAQNGYTSSFNVSEQLLQKTNKDSLDQLLQEVKYVSQDAAHLPLLKKLFPDKPVLTWDTRFSNFFNPLQIQKLLDDPQVAIILVNIKSENYR